ncbi:MAG: 1-phosphofructokinase family hexose kinase [Pseudomonadota bacterium]
MTNILTITLNPTVDFATTAPQVLPGPKLRCAEAEFDPGGGGINVARAVRMLGGEATTLIAIGGPTGAQLLELLAFEGGSTVAIQGPGETRRSVSVIDESNGEQYRIVMPGPVWGDNDVERALAAVDRAAGAGSLVVLSGSQPPGVAKDFPSILASHVEGRNARLIVDTSGPALRHLAGTPHEAIYLLRMNVEEAEELAGRELPAVTDTAAFARDLVSRGVAQLVVIARGTDGSVLVSGDEAWHAVAPEVDVVSAVGAGDSFVGGFTHSAAQGEPVEECLRAGVAAAAAAVTSEATRLCDKAVTEKLRGKTRLTKI